MYQEKVKHTLIEGKTQSSRTGIRYSALYQFSCYDAARFTLIDLMLSLEQQNVSWTPCVKKEFWAARMSPNYNILVKPPSDIEGLPSTIANGFTGFTANQWKNWIYIYSLFASKVFICNENYLMWADFVHACKTLYSKVITKKNCRIADEKHLKNFLQVFMLQPVEPYVQQSWALGTIALYSYVDQALLSFLQVTQKHKKQLCSRLACP